MSSKTLANSNPPPQNQQRQNQMATPPSPFRIRLPVSNTPAIPVPQIAVPTKPTEKKVKWGPAVWFALHTLAEKVKDESFSKIREPLLKWIYAICTHLPCPDCSMHAKTYLDGFNFNTIQTKTDLKRMIFDFHNTVNARKGYPQFAYEELDAKYSAAITANILQNFIIFFEDRKHRSVKLIATDLHRALMSNEFKKWFNENVQYFSA
jgi:hypothetical protein